MNKIKRLEQHVIQKIAAGEIVERPAHIIKELLENALDAGATRVTLTIQNGGKDLIIIEDDGSGMSKEDALLSVEHHTTSKLESVEDLETLQTYGFRGEALSSISSVSHMTITTRDTATTEGFSLHVSGGILQTTKITAAPIGTTISVADLFFNVPARKKFLKQESTELNHIKQLFYATCFQALSVYFTFLSNGRTIFSCPAVSNVIDRFLQLDGMTAQSHMLSLQPITNENVTIAGLISDTQYVSYDRSDIFIFVNNRWIKNTTITRSLINGYANSLPPGKYPRAVLYITIDPAEVDINIHPKKEEVRFLHPRRIEQMVQEAVRKTLEAKISKIMTQSKSHTQGPSVIAYQSFPNYAPSGAMKMNWSENNYMPITQEHSIVSPSTSQMNQYIPVAEQIIQANNTTQEKITRTETFVPIGQIFNTYILATLEKTLYIIDQHAAHERIMFERLVAGHQGLLAVRQAFPLLITMPQEQQQLLLQYEPLFSSSGICIESFDSTNLIVTATPAQITQHNLEDLCKEVIQLIKNESVISETVEQRLLHHIRCHIACKAAVKAGDHLDNIGMLQLVADLATVPNRFCCPHGRPTIWEITITDLEKWFKRRM